MLALSKKWYDTLPAPLQQIVLEEGRAVHAELLEWTKKFYNESIQTWKEQTKDGFIVLTPDQQAAFVYECICCTATAMTSSGGYLTNSSWGRYCAL